jgi:hypothetical protein
MKLILAQAVLTCNQGKLALMHFNHQRIFAPTNRTITHSQFWKIGLNFKLHRATMTAATILPHFTMPHHNSVLHAKFAVD